MFFSTCMDWTLGRVVIQNQHKATLGDTEVSGLPDVAFLFEPEENIGLKPLGLKVS